MSALFDLAAAVEHDDLVGTDDGGEPVGDHDHGLARHEPLEGLLNQVLVLGVGERGRLVQHHDGRVRDDRAHDGYPLLLAAGQVDALGAYYGGVAVRKPSYERIRLGGLRGLDHLVVGRPRSAAPDVVRDALAEQMGILEHQAQAAHQLVLAHLADVDAADEHLPRIDVPEAGDEVGKGRLARAARPHDRAHRAGGDVERDVAQSRPCAVPVREGHIPQGHRGVLRCPRRLRRGKRLNTEHGINAIDVRLGEHPVLAHVEDLREDARYRMHEQEVEDEREHERRPVLRARGEEYADGQDEQVRVVENGRETRHGVPEEECDVERKPRVVLDRVGEPLERARRLAEGLHDAHAANVLHGGVAHLLFHFLVAPHARHDALVGVAGKLHDARDGDRRQCGDAETPVEDEQQRHQDDGRGGGSRQVRDGVPDELLDPADAFVHDLRNPSRPEPSDVPEGNPPEVGGYVELRAVLRVERRGMGAYQRGEVASHIGDYPHDRHDRIFDHGRNVDSRQVRIDPGHVPDHEVDRHVRDEGRRRGQDRQRHGREHEGLSFPRELEATGKRPRLSLFLVLTHRISLPSYCFSRKGVRLSRRVRGAF